MITMIAAVLTIAVSLIPTSAVSDLHSSSSGSSAPSVNVPTGHHQTVGPVWNRNPFAPLLRAPVAAPWTDRPGFLAG
jgi:hypothetical protein